MRVPEAQVDRVRRAAAAGNVDALFTLATWMLAGDPVPRDLAAARALLGRARAIGHVDAALMEIALVANGSGGPADWPRATALLARAAVADPVAAAQQALLQAMALRPDGAPERVPAAETLVAAPLVRRVPALLSPAECAHLARTGAPFLAPALVADPQTGRNRPDPVRRCSTAVIGPAREDLVVRAILLRIAAVTGTVPAAGEPLTVLRYGPGEEFRPHLDTLPGAAAANQRRWTVLVYLNQGYAGGETRFDALDLTVAGRAGDALIFANTDATGTPDPRTRHAGLPIRTGTKWLATRWIRSNEFSVWD